MKLKSKTDYRERRHLRLRQRVVGTAEKPRLSVFVSGKHMYVQFIDDGQAVTLAAASTQSKGLKAEKLKNNVQAAKDLGKLAAQVAKEKGIQTVVFDRGGFTYAGRVKALADAAREAGLKF